MKFDVVINDRSEDVVVPEARRKEMKEGDYLR